MNNYTKPQEKLFLNTLAFTYPEKPVTFYFSKENKKGKLVAPLYLKNFPANIKSIFPDIKNDDTIYTSFDYPVDDFIQLDIDFSQPENYYLVKRYYNRKIRYYFNKREFIVDENSITKDNQIWVPNTSNNERKDCDKYDRFTLKVDYDNFMKRSQLVLAFDRPTLVLKQSVAEFLDSAEETDPFDANAKPQPSVNLINRVLYVEERTSKDDSYTYTYYTIDKYEYLVDRYGFDNSKAYPILSNELSRFLEINDETDEQKEDENIQYADYIPPKRFKIYFEKINDFYHQFLKKDTFKEIIPISDDGFSWVQYYQGKRVDGSSKYLRFGNQERSYKPQFGLNNGPFGNVPKPVELMAIFAEENIDDARNLLKYFHDNYKNFFDGLQKYIGREFEYAPPEFHIHFKNKSNPLPEIQDAIFNLNKESKISPDKSYVAIYLSPINKDTKDDDAKKIYYQVKELLLKYNIVSQSIVTAKMQHAIEEDQKLDWKGNEKKNFAYTLQNMSLAINAKLGGIPWRIDVEDVPELIVGIGAYKQDKTQFIGSAISFNNVGTFNSFDYFQKNELKELAGSIIDKIIQYTQSFGEPKRLIIHYYKQFSLVKEYPYIEEALESLNLGNIPIYIVTVNKTESEDIVVFDSGRDKYSEYMPYSGRYIKLSNSKYLLCNNTRYENNPFSYRDGYPFPIKLTITCPTNPDEEIDDYTIKDLVSQVYQFSRIYWKSVKQQNLPVTIKYPEMIAQMLPHFENKSVKNNNLWFL